MTMATSNREDRETSSTKLLFLPNEIIRKIIHHLSAIQDKSALARCMRVSPDFNRIVAPLLYRSIPLHTDASVLANYSTTTVSSRKSLSKEELLDLVDEVDMTAHDGLDCTFDPTTWKDVKWTVSIIRARHTGTDCSCLDHFLPKKLIIETSHPPGRVPLSVRVSPSVEDLVIIMQPGGIPFYRADLRSGQAFRGSRPHRAVIIFWTPDPTASFESERKRNHPLLRPLAISSHFNSDLAWLATTALFPDDITVVNISSLWSLVDPTTSPSANEACSERFKWRIASLQNSTPLIQDRASDTVNETKKWRTVAEVEKVKVKFIDMETYLTDYDWKGEFSDEEIAPWLEEIKRRDEAKEEENE